MNLIYLESTFYLDRISHYLENNEIDFFKRGYSFFVLTERNSKAFSRNLKNFLYLYKDSSTRLDLKISDTLNDNMNKEEFSKFKNCFL